MDVAKKTGFEMDTMATDKPSLILWAKEKVSYMKHFRVVFNALTAQLEKLSLSNTVCSLFQVMLF